MMYPGTSCAVSRPPCKVNEKQARMALGKLRSWFPKNKKSARMGLGKLRSWFPKNKTHLPSSIKFFLFFILSNSILFAGHTIHFGAVTMGRGGSNPVSIPPTNLLEYEYVWLTAKSNELTIGISPGVFYGHRFMISDPYYVSLGAGLVLDGNGMGPGAYSALGANFYCSWACLNLEIKQAMGFGGYFIFPFALRVGVTFGL